MTKVVVRDGKNGLESALRTFKQKTAKDGLLKEVRERNEGYMKPGVKRRKAKKEAIKNSRKKERLNRAY
ncbi:MAG: 30S ribosomal protein S21 [Bacilli bacterium]|nr:30S ribosomal protein S21 [Bacilli bacterium]